MSDGGGAGMHAFTLSTNLFHIPLISSFPLCLPSHSLLPPSLPSRFYCEADIAKLRPCASCRQGIAGGAVVTKDGARFHPACAVCSFCS